MAGLIPMRPKGLKFNLLQEEMDGLTYYILSGCPREVAFLKFVRPDFVGSKAQAAIKAAVTQFFAVKEVKDYIEAYKATIDELLNPKPGPRTPSGNIEERKAKAKTKLVEFAMDLANNIDKAEDPEFVLKVADKAGLLDMGEEVEEVPRRYLPEICSRCRYRQFCEDNTVDMCQYCKYRQYGEENGIHYEPECQLDITGTEVVEG